MDSVLLLHYAENSVLLNNTTQCLLWCSNQLPTISSWFCFDFILYAPVNIFSVMSGWVFLGWTSTKQGLMCLAQEHNTETQMRLEPITPRSSVMHPSTEPLHSLNPKLSNLYHWTTGAPRWQIDRHMTGVLWSPKLTLSLWVRGANNRSIDSSLLFKIHSKKYVEGIHKDRFNETLFWAPKPHV